MRRSVTSPDSRPSFARNAAAIDRAHATPGLSVVAGGTYDDSEGAAYGLTGAVLATDRAAIDEATDRLRFAAGNSSVNDRPTGAVVGQQPFGGRRASGTDDTAGSILDLQRWTSPRSIEESVVPATDHRSPHMD